MLTGQPNLHGQAAHALIFGACKSNKRMSARIAADVVSIAADLLAWVDTAAAKCLGGIAARSAGGLALRRAAKESVANFDLDATTIVRVWAATPSTDSRQATHLPSHDGQLGDVASYRELLAGLRAFESDVLKPVWGGPGRIAMLPPSEHNSQGAFGLVGLTAACQGVGLGTDRVLAILRATFEEIRDAAAEIRRTKHSPPVDVVRIVRAKCATYIDDSARSLAARQEARAELQEERERAAFASSRGSPAWFGSSRAASPGMPYLPSQPWDAVAPAAPISAFSLPEETPGGGYDAFSPARVRERIADRPHSALRPQPRYTDARRSPSRERSRSRERELSRSRLPRDSMPANRERLTSRDRDRDAGRDRDRDDDRDRSRRLTDDEPRPREEPPPRPRTPRQPSQERDDKEPSRRPPDSRSRRGEQERSSSRGRGDDEGPIGTHGDLGRAFRLRARTLGLPPTCVFAACFLGGCTKPDCHDCANLGPFSRAKHAALVSEMRARSTDAYAAAVRWRDTG